MKPDMPEKRREGGWGMLEDARVERSSEEEYI
jgi:hypothetical protein